MDAKKSTPDLGDKANGFKNQEETKDNLTCTNTTKPEPINFYQSEPIEDKGYTMVYFDMETTSGNADTEICQLSAVCDGTDTFNQYILPEYPFNQVVSSLTGLSLDGDAMLLRGVPVDTVNIRRACTTFIDWLKAHGKVVLVGHNVKNFDSLHLLRIMGDLDLLTQLADTLVGFIDSLIYFRQTPPRMASYKLTSLVDKLLKRKFDAYNALSACTAVRDLLANKVGMFDHSFSLQWAIDHYRGLQKKRDNLKTFGFLISTKVIRKSMASKCAASGICVQHIEEAVHLGGRQELLILLGAKINGKKRVTTRKAVIDKLCSHFEH